MLRKIQLRAPQIHRLMQKPMDGEEYVIWMNLRRDLYTRAGGIDVTFEYYRPEDRKSGARHALEKRRSRYFIEIDRTLKKLIGLR